MLGCEEVGVCKALEELWARFGVVWFDRAEKGLAAAVLRTLRGNHLDRRSRFVL